MGRLRAITLTDCILIDTLSHVYTKYNDSYRVFIPVFSLQGKDDPATMISKKKAELATQRAGDRAIERLSRLSVRGTVFFRVHYDTFKHN